jgi:hypothetical protein
MYHVTFKNGAMTKIHTHESEQILIATTSSSENSNNRLDVGRGFVVIIEKVRNTARMILNLISAKQFFLIRLEILFVFHQMYYTGSSSKEQDFSHIAIRRSTLDNKQQAKSLWEYDTLAMKKVMGVMDDKVSSILSEMHNKIKMVISG